MDKGIKNKKLYKIESNNILEDFQDSYAYEVIRLINSRPLFLELHYQRLVNTCKSLKVYPPEFHTLAKDIQKLVEQNQLENINVKIAIDQNNYAVFPIPSKYPSKEDYLRGVSCGLLFEERENPEIKAFKSELREKSNKQISQQEIYESVLVNREGQITEGSRSNLFFIQGNEIYTAPDHLVLAGITRMKVLELCKELNLNVEFKAISTRVLNQIDAAFICGTSPGVLPISNIKDFHFDFKNSVLLEIHHAYHSKYLQ